jgi:hypothetical protein
MRHSRVSRRVSSYLKALPYTVQTKCGTGEYWQAVNVNPAFTPKGNVQQGLIVPPTNQRSIGDVLSAHNISIGDLFDLFDFRHTRDGVKTTERISVGSRQ